MDKNSKYKRNILFLTIHLMFSKRITGPVMMLLYQAYGLSYGQIGTLSSITWLTDSSMEIYGGAVSDVYGRKKASLLYGLLGMASMALFVFGRSFPYFAIANAIYGFSLAIGSGNASALLFDTLTVLRLEKQYKKYRGKMQFPPKLMNGLIILALPFLYLHNIKYPYMLGFGFYFISFITALLFLIEPPRKRGIVKPEIIKTAFSAMKEIISNKKVMLALALEVVLSGFILLMFEYFQPILKIAGMPLAYFGIVYAIARLFEGLGSLFFHKLGHSNKRLIFFDAIMILFALIGFAFTKSFILIAFIFLACLIDGATDVLFSDIINKNISSKNRTTIMSTGNMFNSFFVALILFTFGHVSDKVGVQSMFGLAGLSFLTLLLMVFLFMKIAKWFKNR